MAHTGDEYDGDILMHLNAAMLDLNQIGVGPEEGFVIDDTTDWDSLTNGNPKLEALKSILCMKVKIAFIPPENSTALDALKHTVERLEWRLNWEYESGNL